MKIKILTITTVFILTACSNPSYSTPRYTTNPYTGYKISKEEMKRYLLEVASLDMCLKNKVASNSEFYMPIIVQKALENVIGIKNAEEIRNHSASSQHFTKLAGKMAPTLQAKIPLYSSSKCEAAKQAFEYELKIVENSARIHRQDKAEQQARLAREEKARQEFYATPQGQAYLAQQNLQAMQYYQQQQLLEQQRAQQERQAWIDFGNSVQQSAQNVTNMLQNNTRMLNELNYQGMMYNQRMMENWAPKKQGITRCTQFGNTMTCKDY